MKASPADQIEIELAVSRSKSVTSPHSLQLDKRTNTVCRIVKGSFSASHLRALADDLDRINSELARIIR